MAEDYLLKKIT